MKRIFTILIFSFLHYVSYAWTGGPRINNVNYPNGATIYIPCGTGLTLTIEVWRDSGLGNAPYLGTPTMIPGWLENQGCPNNTICLNANASSGGNVSFSYSNLDGHYSGQANFTVSRNPIDLVINGTSPFCSTATYSLSGTYTGGVTWSSRDRKSVV